MARVIVKSQHVKNAGGNPVGEIIFDSLVAAVTHAVNIFCFNERNSTDVHVQVTTDDRSSVLWDSHRRGHHCHNARDTLIGSSI